MRKLRYYASPVDVVMEAGSTPTAFTGIAMNYNKPSREMRTKDGVIYREMFAPGSFAKSLADLTRDVICTVSHNDHQPLGRKSRGTLTLTDNPETLIAMCLIPPTSYANDLQISISRGDVAGMSFTYDDEIFEWFGPGKKDELPVCYITEASLFEVCFSSAPFYEDTTAGMRSMPKLGEVKERIVSNSRDLDRVRLSRFGIRIGG